MEPEFKRDTETFKAMLKSLGLSYGDLEQVLGLKDSTIKNAIHMAKRKGAQFPPRYLGLVNFYHLIRSTMTPNPNPLPERIATLQGKVKAAQAKAAALEAAAKAALKHKQGGK